MAETSTMEMILQIQPPNWADVLQALGAIIGVPGAMAAFILLFIKDKHKQQQLDNLKEIAVKIEAQNETLKESNDLASEQIDVLRKMLLSPSNSGYDKLAEIEEKKLKHSVKPNLKSNGQSYRMSEFWVDITNIGETAIVDNIYFDKSRFSPLNHIKPGHEIEKNKTIKVGFRTKDNTNSNYISYDIEIKLHDQLGNLYTLKIKRDHQQNSFEIKQTEV